MGMMMKHVHYRYREVFRLGVTDIRRVGISGNSQRFTVINMLKMRDGLLLLFGNITVRQRAKMCAECGRITAYQTEGIFKIASQSK